jgi:hypothetical protein
MHAVKAKLMSSFSERNNLLFVALGSGDQHQRGLADLELRLVGDFGDRNLVVADKSAVGAAQISKEYFFIAHFNRQMLAGNFLVRNDQIHFAPPDQDIRLVQMIYEAGPGALDHGQGDFPVFGQF